MQTRIQVRVAQPRVTTSFGVGTNHDLRYHSNDVRWEGRIYVAATPTGHWPRERYVLVRLESDWESASDDAPLPGPARPAMVYDSGPVTRSVQ